MTDRQAWRTPRPLGRKLCAEFKLRHDAAADATNYLLPRYWDEETNALAFPWPARVPIWCNPPFALAAKFAERALEHRDAGGRSVFLCLDRGTLWLERAKQRARWWGFMGRVKYEPPPGIKASSPTFGSTLLVLDQEPARFMGWRDPETGEVLE